jgi:hypothetical protein
MSDDTPYKRRLSGATPTKCFVMFCERTPVFEYTGKETEGHTLYYCDECASELTAIYKASNGARGLKLKDTP